MNFVRYKGVPTRLVQRLGLKTSFKKGSQRRPNTVRLQLSDYPNKRTPKKSNKKLKKNLLSSKYIMVDRNHKSKKHYFS